MLILDKVEKFGQSNPKVFSLIHFYFNEIDKSYWKLLDESVKKHVVYSRLKYCPLITNQNAEDVDLSQIKSNRPVFSFVDPFGYASTSARQIWNLVNNVGSDCVFFFNANRITVDINKPDQEHYFYQLFGNEFPRLKEDIQAESSHRQKMIKVLRCFSDNLYNSKKPGYKLYILPFGFDFDDRNRQSHYLLFITKNHKAVTEMKTVMSKLATSITETYNYDSKAVNQISLFDEPSEVINDILSGIMQYRNKLLSQSWTVPALLEHIDNLKMETDKRVTPFSLSNFRKAIREAHDRGLINEKFDIKGREIFSDKRQFTFKDEKMEAK